MCDLENGPVHGVGYWPAAQFGVERSGVLVWHRLGIQSRYRAGRRLPPSMGGVRTKPGRVRETRSDAGASDWTARYSASLSVKADQLWRRERVVIES